jgi:hypothetical protein
VFKNLPFSITNSCQKNIDNLIDIQKQFDIDINDNLICTQISNENVLEDKQPALLSTGVPPWLTMEQEY